MWLALDASTHIGSVAVGEGDTVIAHGEVMMRDPHRELLMPLVQDLVTRVPGGWSSLDEVIVGGGPGSFTSLRIAASIAKGVATASGLALCTMSSLALLAASQPRGTYLSTLDAMRGEHYTAAFEVMTDGTIRPQGPRRRLTPDVLRSDARRDGMIVLGDAASEVLRCYPTAAGAAILRRSGLVTRVDLATWEPDYGRLAEAQVQWEAAHGRPLQSTP